MATSLALLVVDTNIFVGLTLGFTFAHLRVPYIAGAKEDGS